MKYDWTVKAQDVGTTNVDQDIDNIQGITIDYGRRLFTDPLKGGVATIRGRRPDLLPTIFIGQVIEISTTYTSGTFTYTFYLADYIIDYGIVSAEDEYTIICEDALGSAGRVTVTASTPNDSPTRVAIYNMGNGVNIDSGVLIGPNPTLNGVARTSAISVTNENLLTLFNKINATEQGDLFGGIALLVSATNIRKLLSFKVRSEYEFVTAEFTDTTPQVSAIAAQFDRVEFAGLSQQYADRVIVNPEGLASQTAGTGRRVYEVATYDVSTAQAANTAAYILSQSSTATDVPVAISCTDKIQTNDAALETAEVAKWFNLALRGGQYTCKVQGGVISITPDQTRFTYFVQLMPQNSFRFVLDSTTNGVLDTSELG